LKQSTPSTDGRPKERVKPSAQSDQKVNRAFFYLSFWLDQYHWRLSACIAKLNFYAFQHAGLKIFQTGLGLKGTAK
jgi:hypothetical protein